MRAGRNCVLNRSDATSINNLRVSEFEVRLMAAASFRICWLKRIQQHKDTVRLACSGFTSCEHSLPSAAANVRFFADLYPLLSCCMLEHDALNYEISVSANAFVDLCVQMRHPIPALFI
jgi:hypothetical protein